MYIYIYIYTKCIYIYIYIYDFVYHISYSITETPNKRHEGETRGLLRQEKKSRPGGASSFGARQRWS